VHHQQRWDIEIFKKVRVQQDQLSAAFSFSVMLPVWTPMPNQPAGGPEVSIFRRPLDVLSLARRSRPGLPRQPPPDVGDSNLSTAIGSGFSGRRASPAAAGGLDKVGTGTFNDRHSTIPARPASMAGADRRWRHPSIEPGVRRWWCTLGRNRHRRYDKLNDAAFWRPRHDDGTAGTGKLTVAGDLTFAGTSIYSCRSRPPDNTSTSVTGTAALHGATVNANNARRLRAETNSPSSPRMTLTGKFGPGGSAGPDPPR